MLLYNQLTIVVLKKKTKNSEVLLASFAEQGEKRFERKNPSVD